MPSEGLGIYISIIQTQNIFQKISAITTLPSTPDVNEGEVEHRAPYNHEDKTFDCSRLRPTDLPFNKIVHLLPAADEDMEAKISFTRSHLNKAFNKHLQGSR